MIARQKWISLFVFLFFLFGQNARADFQSDLVEARDNAHALFKQGQTEPAKKALLALEEKGVLWSVVYEDLAQLAQAEGDLSKAQNYLDQALELEPFSGKAHRLAFRLAEKANDQEKMQYHGRWFLGLTPKHPKATSIATLLGLVRSDYGFFADHEKKTLNDFLSRWAAYFVDKEQTFHLEVQAKNGGKPLTVRTRVFFKGIMWVDGGPAARLIFEEALNPGDGEYHTTCRVEMLVARQATIKALSFAGDINLPGAGPDLPFSFKTSTLFENGKLTTMSRGVGIKGKPVKETFRFVFDPLKEISSRDSKSLWGKISRSHRKKILKQIAAGEVRCQVWGWGVYLDGTVSAVLLAQMDLPEKPTKVPILHMIVPHAGISNRSITFNEFSSYGSPFVMGSYLLQRQNNIKTVKIGKQRLDVVAYQLDKHRVMVHESGRIVRLNW